MDGSEGLCSVGFCGIGIGAILGMVISGFIYTAATGGDVGIVTLIPIAGNLYAVQDAGAGTAAGGCFVAVLGAAIGGAVGYLAAGLLSGQWAVL